MKILYVHENLVEILWLDNNEIEYISIADFCTRYGVSKLEEFLDNSPR